MPVHMIPKPIKKEGDTIELAMNMRTMNQNKSLFQDKLIELLPQYPQ
jgi:hypothetical protein